MSAAATMPGPVRVATVDVSRPIEDLDCAHYDSAWILVVDDGRPFGMVEVPLAGPTLAASELEALLRRELAASWPAAPRPAAASADVALPSATVIVPTVASRADELLSCARLLSALDYPDFDVVVVDNRRGEGEGDAVLAAVAALPHVRVVRERRPGISAARNAGLRAARGDFVAYTDDDVEVDARWLLALGRRFAADPAAAAVSGLVMPKELETPAQVWFERSGSGLDRSYVALTFELSKRFRVTRRAEGEPGATVQSLYAMGEFGLGSNMAFRTAALRARGGFDEALGAGTETCGGEDLAALVEVLTSGSRLVHDPAAIVHHIHRRGVDELERQLRGYGVGLTATLAALVWRHPRHLLGLLGIVVPGLRSILRPADGKRAKQSAGYPDHLVRLEHTGMLRGPLAYARSRRFQRRWSA